MPDKPRGPSQRQLRVGEMIRQALSDVLTRGEIHDDDLAGSLVTITEVRMSPDLKLATAYVRPLGNLQPAGPIIKALARHAKFIRGQVAPKVNLKYAPQFRFREDDVFDEAQRIEELLASPQVRRDVEKD
ncbi:MAG: 30S ribosome-binding factor RbfA [Pseudomonadota bacterium]